MRPLEEIAANPKVTTISENLVLVADPFGDFKDGISQDVMDKIIEALIEKFIEGEGLISRFRADLVTLESQKTSFRPYEIDNFYQKLEKLMKTRPKHLENQLKRAWNGIKEKRVKLKEGSRDLTELSHYTHQWRSRVEKNRGSDPFEALKHVPDHGITLYLHEKPNKGYPIYLVYGWQERVKVREAIVNKLLLTIFELLENIREKSGYDKNKFYASFGTKVGTKDYRVEDYFGVKIIGTSWNIRPMIEGLIYSKDSQWLVDTSEESNDLRVIKGRPLGIFKYSLRHKTVETTEMLKLHVTTFMDFLFDDFFLENSHPRYKLRNTIRELARYEKENPRLYERMRKSLCNALDFLPR